MSDSCKGLGFGVLVTESFSWFLSDELSPSYKKRKSYMRWGLRLLFRIFFLEALVASGVEEVVYKSRKVDWSFPPRRVFLFQQVLAAILIPLFSHPLPHPTSVLPRATFFFSFIAKSFYTATSCVKYNTIMLSRHLTRATRLPLVSLFPQKTDGLLPSL